LIRCKPISALENIWPDEQRLFFDEIAPSRDGWDGSFCCGSCSIARRKAVEAIGGFPTEPITAGFIVVTALGIVINIVPETARIQGAFSPIAALWAGINIMVLVIASLICFEKPRRLFQAFKLDEAANVDGSPGRLVSLSVEKAVIAVPTETRFQSTSVRLSLDGFEPIEAELRQATQRRGDIRRSGDTRRYYLHLRFDLNGVERDKMIVKLTGRYSQDIPDIDKVAVSVNLLLRAFGRTRTA